MTPFPPIDRTAASFKSDLDAMFLSRLPNFVNELNALQGNMNSIAAGGAYVIPYTVSGDSANIGKGGFFTLQGNNDTIYFDDTDGAGNYVKAILTNLFSGSSGVKATLKLIEVTDPSRFIIWNIFGFTAAQGSTKVTAQLIADTNGGRNLTAGIAMFSRTGDKGDSGSRQFFFVSDQKPSGTSGGDSVGNNFTQTRVLNSVDLNTIPGASLSGNIVTLPAGVYLCRGRAPAYSVNGHQAILWSPSLNSQFRAGSSAYSDSNLRQCTDSILDNFQFTISSSQTFSLRHYTTLTASGGLGTSAGSGAVNVYSQLGFERIG